MFNILNCFFNSPGYKLGIILGYLYLIILPIPILFFSSLNGILWFFAYFIPGLGYLMKCIFHTPWYLVTAQTLFLLDVCLFILSLKNIKVKNSEINKKLNFSVVNFLGFIIFISVSVTSIYILKDIDYDYFLFKKSNEVKEYQGSKIARSMHNLTLLKDGNVLISGGQSKKLEIFKAKNNTITQAGELKMKYSNNAILLDDGKVLLLGDKTEIYDPLTYDSVLIEEKVNLIPPYNLLKLSNGNVLIYDSFPTRIFDIKKQTFSDLKNLPFITDAFNMRDGNVLILTQQGICIFSLNENKIIRTIKVSDAWFKHGKYVIYNDKKNIIYCISNIYLRVVDLNFGKEDVIKISAPLSLNEDYYIKPIKLNEEKILFTNSNHRFCLFNLSSVPCSENKMSSNILIFDIEKEKFSRLNLGKPYRYYQAVKLTENKVLFTGGKIDYIDEQKGDEVINDKILIYSY